jgi:hypothetical protein
MLPERPSWFVYADVYEAIRVLGEARPDFRDLALHVFAAYEEYYKVNTWTPVLVEHQFVVQFEGGPYSARTDLLAIENGEYVLIDHKILGKLTPTVGARYATDRQMLTGLAIARASGYDVRRVVINAGTREMPYPSFRRFDVPINHEAFNRLGADTEYYIKQQAYVRQLYPDPMNRPRNFDACMTKFNDGFCEYYGLCFGGASVDQFIVPADYVHGRLKGGT